MHNKISQLDLAGGIASLIVAIVLILALSGCGTLNQYQRTYSATYDADRQSGEISMTLRPVAPLGAPNRPDAVAAMNDEVIAKIVKLVAAEAKKNAGKEPPISLTQEVPFLPDK